MNPFQRLGVKISNWWRGEPQNDGGKMTLNSPSFLERIGLKRKGKPTSEVTYFTCLKMLSETLAKMPIKYYQKTDKGIIEAEATDTSKLLSKRPNPFMTPTTFWNTVEINRNHYGNGYVYMRKKFDRKKFGGEIKIVDLWVMQSNCVQIVVDDAGIFAGVGRLWYVYTDPTSGRQYVFSTDEVMHFKTSFSFDGITGLELQNRFDLLYDLDEDEQDGIENKVKDGTAKQVGGDVKPDKKNIVKSFVNIVKAGFLHKEADEADIKVYKDALTSDTTAGSEGEVGIGVTIPEDIRTDIIELRRSSDNLEQYVNVEGVTTKTGTRNIEVDAESTPFDNVDEAADFPEMDEPEFLPIEYKVKKKGGILKMTAELLEDTASNIMAYINKWIAKKTKATRNAMILKVLDEMTKRKEVTVENLDSLKDIFNEQLDPAIADNAVVITNQSGFNYLDKLKDKDGNYILQKDPTQQTKGKMLFGEYPIIKLSKKTLASEKIMNTDGHTIDGYKHPIFCGDLKEAVTLFDRNVLTIDLNDKGAGLWDKDMTGIKVRDRFDVQPVDKGAVIKGQITEVING